ncbi:hypothetical protein [Luteimicrobium subarcticum]|uniref:Uncharacterized protein n=1 Tax=Luteimicrobium subarcticum TaxID=620910 RepID=A0A2M8W700_9MICO|nr:hypothetical protein [Luteimicrobium subarcticum]PJI86710.1 hypothetical protein CLV34_2630 [Luteimicrobium subarcticum]
MFSLAFLPLVLPMGPAALATTTGTELRADGAGLRDARHRWVAVASSDAWEPRPERPRPGSPRRLGAF